MRRLVSIKHPVGRERLDKPTLTSIATINIQKNLIFFSELFGCLFDFYEMWEETM